MSKKRKGYVLLVLWILAMLLLPSVGNGRGWKHSCKTEPTVTQKEGVYWVVCKGVVDTEAVENKENPYPGADEPVYNPYPLPGEETPEPYFTPSPYCGNPASPCE